MVFITLALKLVGYGSMALYAYRVWKGLAKHFPSGSPSRWWWTRDLPIPSFALVLLAIGEQPLYLVPGVALLGACGLWLHYWEQRSRRDA